MGFVTKDMIEKHMPTGGVGSATHGEGEKVLMCGPPLMMTAMKWVASHIPPMIFAGAEGSRVLMRLFPRAHLKEIGYPPPRSVSKLEDQVFSF